MNIYYTKKFLKELSKLPLKDRRKIENFVFVELPNFKSIYESGIIEKLKGYSDFYKARFGDFRIGIYYTNNELTLQRALHRKEIYKVFP